MPPRPPNPYEPVGLPEEAVASQADVPTLQAIGKQAWDMISAEPALMAAVREGREPTFAEMADFGALLAAGGLGGAVPKGAAGGGAIRSMMQSAQAEALTERIALEKALATPLTRKAAKVAAPELVSPEVVAAMERAKAAGVKQAELDKLLASLPGPEGAVRPVGGGAPPKVQPQFAKESRYAGAGPGVLQRDVGEIVRVAGRGPGTMPGFNRPLIHVPGKGSTGPGTSLAATTQPARAATSGPANPYTASQPGAAEKAWQATKEFTAAHPKTARAGLAGAALATLPPAAMQAVGDVRTMAGHPEQAKGPYGAAQGYSDFVSQVPRAVAGAVASKVAGTDEEEDRALAAAEAKRFNITPQRMAELMAGQP